MATRRSIAKSNANIAQSLEHCPACEELVLELLGADDMFSLFKQHIEANPELASPALQAGIGTLWNAMRVEELQKLEPAKAGMN
ncbi:MAG: hypothetical protein ABJZ55_10175 [Fuerstiella sp.]